MLKLVGLLGVLALAAANNGNWGIFKIMNRNTKCYSYDEGRNEMWTRNCNKLDDLQIWRWDQETSQLQNLGMTKRHGTPYCATQSAIGNLKPVRMGPCLNGPMNKFIMKSENGAQEFAISLDSGRCIDVDRWSEARDENIWTAPCESYTRSRTDHWTVFEQTAKYKGGDKLLLGLSKQANSGDWGLYHLMNRNEKCYSYDEGRNEMWTRACNKLDSLQLWRYDQDTQQLQNKGMTERHGRPYCAIQSAIGSLKPIRMAECSTAAYQKFNMVSSNGAQQFSLQLDASKCIDVDRWSEARDENIWTAPCESITRSRTDHWTVFEFVEAGVKCAGGKYNKGGKCVRCPANTYSNQGDNVCVNCPADQYSSAGSTQCRENCYPGYFMNGKSWNCIACRVNTYSDTMNAASCTKCPTGYEALDIGATGCTRIPQKCPAGTWKNGKSWHCVNCPVNTYSDKEDAASCTKCPTGYEAPRTGSTTCTPVMSTCPAGTYMENPRFTFSKCIDCPANTYSDKENSASCTTCPDGHQSAEGSTTCTPVMSTCPAGTYMENPRFTFSACIKCPANTYSDQENSAACTKCPTGYESAEGSTTCTKASTTCPAGKYLKNPKFTFSACLDCPKNTYSEKENSAKCTKCPKGYETKTTGSTTCTLIQVTVTAFVKSSTVQCRLNKKRPQCAVQCRFRTSTGVTLKDPNLVTFYKKVGKKWMVFGDGTYNGRYRWHSLLVGPTAANAGQYKCAINYQGATASAEINVSIS